MDFDLERFVDVPKWFFTAAMEEIRAGRKRTHWMWFVFPQLSGLGRSPLARRYAMESLAEAGAFLEHPFLGKRLRDFTQAVLDTKWCIYEIFPHPDEMKFHSSMTLFAVASRGSDPFTKALSKYFDNRADRATISLLEEMG